MLGIHVLMQDAEDDNRCIRNCVVDGMAPESETSDTRLYIMGSVKPEIWVGSKQGENL